MSKKKNNYNTNEMSDYFKHYFKCSKKKKLYFGSMTIEYKNNN